MLGELWHTGTKSKCGGKSIIKKEMTTGEVAGGRAFQSMGKNLFIYQMPRGDMAESWWTRETVGDVVL